MPQKTFGACAGVQPWGSSQCAMALLAWPMGTAHSWALAGQSPLPLGTAAASRWPSTWGPFLISLWTLMALSYLLGRQALPWEGLRASLQSRPQRCVAGSVFTAFLVPVHSSPHRVNSGPLRAVLSEQQMASQALAGGWALVTQRPCPPAQVPRGPGTLSADSVQHLPS